MQKQKIFLSVVLGTLGAGLLALVCLAIFGVLNVYIALVAILGVLVFCAIDIYFLVALLSKIKKAKLKEEQKVDAKKLNDPNKYIYEALGIPFVYNKDGSLKDIYELLGIEPEFDQEGNRIETIYERLGILPNINKDAVEKPTVFVIKNRARKIAKVDVNHRTLTKKLTPEEQEQIIIRETLKQKLEEAKQLGDKSKEEKIKQALDKKAKEVKKEDSTAKTVKYANGKVTTKAVKSAGKANFVSVMPVGDMNIYKAIFATDKKPAPKVQPKEQDKPIVTTEPNKPKDNVQVKPIGNDKIYTNKVPKPNVNNSLRDSKRGKVSIFGVLKDIKDLEEVADAGEEQSKHMQSVDILVGLKSQEDQLDL